MKQYKSVYLKLKLRHRAVYALLKCTYAPFKGSTYKEL